eukprot:CAMPEP_0182428518 /NCGR_PEP_ID=MMETSP1167-20130531/23076_1 /TAXON_ID=2988 /ORGANISM="Mallomonas Sp, Strain CCMP3275" /LENGTH=174 /DNA_ID=CAMNT_0024611459 /DNA_START=83 /DNA_END=607 /DNA_ORIENTATION=-
MIFAQNILKFLLVSCLLQCALGFNHGAGRFGQRIAQSKTKVFEDFNMDFKNPTLVISEEIFSEVQYREFISQYSVDERINPLEFVLGLFKKGDEKAPAKIPDGTGKPQPSFAKQLKPSVSVAVLEEKTAAYVKGSINAGAYMTVLKAAFGNKLPAVLPEIVASLPASKAKGLSL